jgi:hypothetical protein
MNRRKSFYSSKKTKKLVEWRGKKIYNDFVIKTFLIHFTTHVHTYKHVQMYMHAAFACKYPIATCDRRKEKVS